MGKLVAPKNENYAATVIELKESDFRQLDNCDNVQAVNVRGYQAIVGLDVKPGDLGLLFRAETKLSDDFLSHNNLYRNSEQNKDKSQAGYFEHHGRVRAVRFRGNPSDAFFIPISSLNYIKSDVILKDGDIFDELAGVPVCWKYVPPTKGGQRAVDKNATKKFKRVESKFMPEHFDTPQYRWYTDHLEEDLDIVVTQKLHGTSVRIGHTYVNRELTFIERVLRKLGVRIADREMGAVFGSRKVIKDPAKGDHNHFYDTDIWGQAGAEVAEKLPKNFIVYGEIIGWVSKQKAIQKNYTYGLPPGTHEVYIYRVAVITEGGRLVDLSWDNVKNFCEDYGLNAVPELWRGKVKDFRPEDFKDGRYHDEGYSQAVTMSQAKSKLVDEGICVRAEGRAPLILKAKSPKFLEHETKLLDEEEEDIEEAGQE